uniref:Zinc transporter ZIP14-like n=1 Tax=Crassostrea virginica TaxID=6565 RepID=A0A8B8ERL0_CRAVI|nr:zinc transporter ZIP14-like [Crassostrea virginica]
MVRTQRLVCLVVLTLFSSEWNGVFSSPGDASATLVQWYGTRGVVTQEEFVELGRGVQSGQVVTTSASPQTNDSCPCRTYSQIFQEVTGGGSRMNASTLTTACPMILMKLHSENCCHDNEIAQEHSNKPAMGKAWGYGIGFVSVVVLISNIGVFLGPCMNTSAFKRILMFCVALAVGTLGSTGFLVLIPESMHLTGKDGPIPDYQWKMATVIGGAYFVFVAERLLKFLVDRRKKKKHKEAETIEINGELLGNNTPSHVHSHLPVSVDKDGKTEIAPVAWILLIGDAIHNFVDGLSIGAAFTENTLLGISVSLAVLCEELPHELGDIAILLHAGLSMKRALLYNFIAAVICYIGLVIGLVVGEATSANQWIFGLSGGIFVYIALADMIPEMKEQLAEAERDGKENMFLVFVIQNSGIIIGFLIILCIVQYGGEIQV